MTELYILLRFLAESVHTLDYKSEWYYMLIQVDSVKELLTEVGKQILQVFS